MTITDSDSTAPENDGTGILNPAETTSQGVQERPNWVRNAVLFLSGQTVSLFGSMLVQYAIMWHLTLETKSGLVMGLAAVFGFLPQALISIFAGVWADRMNRKMLIIVADASIAITTLALALFMLSGVSDLWLFYLTLAIRSVGSGVQMPAVAAIIPQIVPTSQLMRINGINGSIQSAMALLAPAVAMLMYVNFSIIAIFFLDVVTAIIGIGFLLLIPVPTIRKASDVALGYFDDLVEGVKYVWNHSFVRWLLTLFGIVFLLAAGPSYLTPLMLVRSFGEEAWMLAVLEISFSVGMMLAGILIAIWAGTKNRVAMIVITSVVFALLTLGMGLTTNLWVFFALMFAFGLAVPYFSTPSMTLLQEKVEPERHGRVFSIMGIVMAIAMPLGMVVLGPLADVFSIESLLVICGVLMVLVVTIAIGIPSGRRAMRAANAPAAQVEAEAEAATPASAKPSA